MLTDLKRKERESVVKRGILVGVTGAAIVVAGLAGCSSNKSNTSSSSSSSAGTASVSPGSAASTAKVSIGGQDQNVNGTVSCVTSNGNVNIGIGGAVTGVGAVLSDASPPAVHSVGLGNVNGVTLGYSDAAPSQGDAQASKDGNSYKITGTATGVDMSNPMQPVNKPFEIDVTCP
jgi:ipoprotein LpqH